MPYLIVIGVSFAAGFFTGGTMAGLFKWLLMAAVALAVGWYLLKTGVV